LDTRQRVTYGLGIPLQNALPSGSFLSSHPVNADGYPERVFMDNSKFDEGLAVRRAVLGDAYVDQALAGADDFTRPLQELVTEGAWGTIWTRPGLPRKTRSLINVALLSVLNRPHELRAHVRGALNNGCTKEEIQEVLLQVAVYGGMPAGVDGFRVAAEVLREAEQ